MAILIIMNLNVCSAFTSTAEGASPLPLSALLLLSSSSFYLTQVLRSCSCLCVTALGVKQQANLVCSVCCSPPLYVWVVFIWMPLNLYLLPRTSLRRCPVHRAPVTKIYFLNTFRTSQNPHVEPCKKCVIYYPPHMLFLPRGLSVLQSPSSLSLKRNNDFFINVLHLVPVQSFYIKHISFCSQTHQNVS